MKKSKENKRYGYRVFKYLIRMLHDEVFYRRTYYIDKQNVPPIGKPTIIVSNHQNCACDPLGLLLGLENESHPYVLARGDVFNKSRRIDKFLAWIGLLPVFRLNFDGEESLKNNAKTQQYINRYLKEGARIIMYPEGGHQDKRYLGDFSLGYTHFAFSAAKAMNFEQDIVILPSCNHYSDYFHMQADYMVRFGTPISLKPFYELYQTKPRTAQREVNKLVRAQIQSLMLDIRDLDNYEAIDFLRESSLGDEYAREHGYNPALLPEKLESDKQLVAALASCKEEQSLSMEEFFQNALTLRDACRDAGLEEKDLLRKPNVLSTMFAICVQVLLLPLWLVSLFPSAIAYNLPKEFLRTDKMFTNTLTFIIGALVIMPLGALIVLWIMGSIYGMWWQAIVWILLFYPLGLFAWYEYKWMQRTLHDVRLLSKHHTVRRLRTMQKELRRQLRRILNVEH